MFKFESLKNSSITTSGAVMSARKRISGRTKKKIVSFESAIPINFDVAIQHSLLLCGKSDSFALSLVTTLEHTVR